MFQVDAGRRRDALQGQPVCGTKGCEGFFQRVSAGAASAAYAQHADAGHQMQGIPRRAEGEGKVRGICALGQARRRLADTEFDIVLINTPLPDDFGMQLAIDICSTSGAGVLLLVKNDHYNDVYAKVVGYGVIALSKPTSRQMVAQNLRILCATRERMRRMQEKQATVEEKIKEIRLVNRAKWLLIECLRMTEAEAHRYIEKQAMDLRISKREAAENIIKTYK